MTKETNQFDPFQSKVKKGRNSLCEHLLLYFDLNFKKRYCCHSYSIFLYSDLFSFSLDGRVQTISLFRDGTLNQSPLVGPCGITVDNDGNIYVSNSTWEESHIYKLTLVQWSRSTHKHFPLSTRESIKALMSLSINPKSRINHFPRDILFLLCIWISSKK